WVYTRRVPRAARSRSTGATSAHVGHSRLTKATNPSGSALLIRAASPRARRASTREALGDVVDRAGEHGDVVGLDRGEQADAQLVAAKLAVGLDVDDPVRSQRRRDLRRVDAVEVDRRGDGAPQRGVGDERGGERARVGPLVDGRGGTVAARRGPFEA